MTRRVKRRYAAERRFKALGLFSVLISLAFLAFLLITMTVSGIGGFSQTFLTASDATDPAAVGIWGALKGSFLTIAVTMALAFPVGVLAAVYLEEFAKRSRFNDFVEVSINNLAAVPSIIFGLLGLAVFLNVMQLPRSAALVGGLTLALMTMPVIVIAGRNAIKAVPPSIRDAALGVGPRGSDIVIAANVAERCVERVGYEGEVFGLEVAGADHEVDLPHPVAGGLRVERRVGLVADRQDADRPAIPAGEWGGVGPGDRQAVGHRP